VGVFAFELVVGYPPFAGETQLASVDKIIHASPEFPEKMSELAKGFITAVRVQIFVWSGLFNWLEVARCVQSSFASLSVPLPSISMT
jgi:hypothetical protein